MQEIASEVAARSNLENINEISKQFDYLETILLNKENPITTAIQFLDSFLADINKRYGTSLTVDQVCLHIKENIHTLPIPADNKLRLAAVIDGLLTEITGTNGALYWPWEWNWFGWNKQEKGNLQERKVTASVTPAPITPPALDGNVIVGTLEILAGASIAIVFGETGVGAAVGGALVYDGVNRVADRGKEDLDSFLRDRRPHTDPPN